MADKTTTLEEQSAAINWAILDLEREISYTGEKDSRQELVAQLATLKDARHTINWLRDVCVFLGGLSGKG